MSKPFSDTSQQPTFQLKGTMLAITVFELAHFNIERLTKELTAKVKEAPEFFGTIPMVLSIDKLDMPLTRVELKGLLTLFKEFNIQLMGLRTDDEKSVATAHKLGLVVLPPTGAREKLIEIAVNRPVVAEPTATEPIVETPEAEQQVPDDGQQQLPIEETQQAVDTALTSSENIPELSNEAIITYESAFDEQASTAPTETNKAKQQAIPTMIVSTPVRSGQQIKADDGDLIVTSNISTGAELIADGNIHIYGIMRGRAMAGFHGNNKARIFCSRLTGELISIAGQMITEEELRRHPLWGKPAQLCLEGNQLTITPLS
ncbi:septum site-determining protein MinC [Entomomonas asaccharolytica]|uniref:Probable septum site-determining protein MinC n=1 Tax=Entomomonas asaccharolytica TaxID=2785331 RepID=A0A974RZE6_9GAMM|nr:septum site-determining protein MinC [Entomomonas asaccharolytica]QQP87004.1 septum site-determining protein MinC [Entomomonas asaccharolytica]